MVVQRIGLTMGDPAGVGPELVLRALAESHWPDEMQIVVFGSETILRRCCEKLGWIMPTVFNVDRESFLSGCDLPSRGPILVDDCSVPLDAITAGQLCVACGEAAFQFINTAIEAALQSKVLAVTTGPINKEALHLAGHNYPGHTEIFAERAGSARWCMMQYSEKITCTFVTVHCGYKEVPELLTVQGIVDTIELTDQAIRQIRGRAGKLLVCGLNPHAGEHGLFGEGEEERIITPAIGLARNKGIDVEGPLPPDTVFIPSKLAMCDAVVCMYHDQGHIPVKALAFEQAVNTTLGIKIVRTSVDHGTAFDIAWKGIAKPDSLFAALRLAAKLALANS